MREETYILIRKISFWFFFCAFLITAPLAVFYSLGYKFSNQKGKFTKTGAVVIETTPKDATVSFAGKKIAQDTPVTVRELLPGDYELLLAKEGYYYYQSVVSVSPSKITKINATLIPRTGVAEKAPFDFNVYRFFVVRQLFGEKLILFTDKGIFIMDLDMKSARQICGPGMNTADAGSIKGILVAQDRLIFWNDRAIWSLNMPDPQEAIPLWADEIYRAQRSIRSVFFGFKDSYILVCSGCKVEAVDVENPQMTFEITQLDSPDADIFYDKAREVIFIRDRLPGMKEFSILRLELAPILEKKDEKKEII